MRMPLMNKKYWASLVLIIANIIFLPAYADMVKSEEEMTMDRVQLVAQQIDLLRNRLQQDERELTALQQKDKEISQLTLEKASKNLVDKAVLDISVSKSNLDSINIELGDSQQSLSWLEKNIQEMENQLNVLSIFGLKIARDELTNIKELRVDLNYQQELLKMEKVRVKLLQKLQAVANTILQVKQDKYRRLNTLLKSRKILHIKQKQVKDELAYQQQQNAWLQELNILYARLTEIDPAQDKNLYIDIEREIFYANENANFSYVQVLVARYKDEIQQMRLAVSKGNSISLLNEIGNQIQILSKQINRVDAVLKSRVSVLEKHILYLSPKKNNQKVQAYLDKLTSLISRYKSANIALNTVNKNLFSLRGMLDGALQTELSARQGLPTFGAKMLIDLGKEILLVPALTFQMIKSLSGNLVKAFKVTTVGGFCLLACVELCILFSFFTLRKLLLNVLQRPSQWHKHVNSKWLSLQWLRHNYIDLFLITNFVGIMYFFAVPLQNYKFIVYLVFVWLSFKSILTVSRTCLLETVRDTAGKDVKLYYRLKWIILIGGIITALTVFINQLPLIYELKTLCDRLFLFMLMVGSLLLLRSWDVVPTLILSHMESQHPYLQKSIRLLGILIPILLFANSLIGLLGFMNLIMTVSWYESIFLIVLIGYLILRGLLTDAIEQLSRLMIQYVHNGWLWTEAVLKPINKVLRITLFLSAGAVLFLLYGWDKQSPTVERLTRLLHYKLASILNTTITPLNILELTVVVSVFYWTAKWTREFVFRFLLSRTKDMGVKNSMAILSQYCVVVLGGFICLRVLGIDLRALAVVAGMFAFGIGLGLRDLANNFACGFLILLERPLRVGDIVNINGTEGEVTHIGGRAVTVRTWDNMELLVPNAEIFNKSFTNWTARDNVVRSVMHIKISRYDNPHEVKLIMQSVLTNYKEVLKDPAPEVYLKEINDTVMDFELRYFVNIRLVSSRVSVMSAVLMNIWDAFAKHGIKPPYPQHEIFLRQGDIPLLSMQTEKV